MKRLRQSIYLIFCAALLLSGCQPDKKKEVDKTEKITYRDSFTEEEKANGTAEFDLMENMKVDAEITPLEKYKDGLKKYYMKHIFETENLKSRNDFINHPILFGRKITKTMDMISDKMDGEFNEELKTDEYSDTEISMSNTFRRKNGATYTFHAYWWTGEEKFGYSEKQVYCPCMNIHIPEGINKAMDTQLDYNIAEFLKDYESMEVSFIEDKEKTGRELKSYLEKLIGRKLSDAWDCIPVTKESVSALKEVYKESGISMMPAEIESEEEFCTYRYYYDVKGFPFAASYLTYQLKEGETASELARMSTPDNTLIGLCNSSILCRITKDGIIDLETSNIRMEGDVYKEAEEVISPDAVLQKVKQYYERQILNRPITVTDVSIVYTGYFTDGSEGEIQPTIAPFWRIRIYDGDTGGSKYFIYDAFTGEAVTEEASAME